MKFEFIKIAQGWDMILNEEKVLFYTSLKKAWDNARRYAINYPKGERGKVTHFKMNIEIINEEIGK